MNLLHYERPCGITVLEMVSELVSMQITLLIKPFATIVEWANKWFFPSVNAHMGFQVEIQGESLVAKVAFVRFFTLELKFKKISILTVCTNICLFSLALSKNLLPQPSWVHWKSLSPWTVLCFFRLALSWKILPQLSNGHLKIFGAWWEDLPVGLLPTMPRGRFLRSDY